MEQASIWIQQPNRPVARDETPKMEAARTNEEWGLARLERDVEVVVIKTLRRWRDEGFLPPEVAGRLTGSALDLIEAIRREEKNV